MYKDFSLIYDRLAFDIPYEAYSQRLKSFLPEKKEARILELGAGSGNLSQYFYEESMIMDLVDQSSQMLALAQEKMPKTEKINYYCADIIDFQPPQSYDFIISNLNVFNYILDKADLYGVFVKMREFLEEKGVFTFDLNSPYKLEEILGNQAYIYEYDNIFYTWDNFLDPPFLDYRMDFFIKEGDLYRRIQEDLTERIYSIKEIEDLLRAAGFKSIQIYDYDKMERPSPLTQRNLFVVS